MSINYFEILFLIVLIVNSILFVVPFINLLFNPTLKITASNHIKPFISILIPMRNEENNIKKLLNSLLEQHYNNFEIIILDDNSTDKSYKVAYSYINKINNLQVVKGKELPKGWLGKNWACHQLSELANGEYLLFLDADVFLKPQAINSIISTANKYSLDALSVFPTQVFYSFGEKLVVPLMNWILLSLLPMVLVRKSRYNSLIAANGQLFLFHKDAYHSINGHLSVKNKPVEDMVLAKKIKSSGYRIGTFIGGDLVFCRMYENFISSIQGFSKNFYSGFNFNWLVFILFILLFSISSIVPFLLVWWDSVFLLPVILVTLNRIFVSYLSKQKIIDNLILHIPQFIVFLLIGIISVYKTKFGKNVWKDRPI